MLSESQSDRHVLLLFGATILGASLEVGKRNSTLFGEYLQMLDSV